MSHNQQDFKNRSQVQRQQERCCQFCKILKNSNKTDESNLLYKDQHIFAFHDIDKSSAKQHILVCTTEHIQTALDVPSKAILYRMKQIGTLILDQLTGHSNAQDMYRFGFHLRPYNSIDHIHLHCFVLPFSSFLKDKIAYGKLLTSVDEVIQRLQGNKLRARL